MKKGQTLLKDGYEVLLFPMEYMNITQGNNEGTHLGTNALDNAGKNTGIDETIAPCSMRLVAYDTAANGNAVFFESTNKVWFRDGTLDYATIMAIHDNYIGDILGVVNFKQGWTFGDEGTAGQATGNHLHLEVAKGKFRHMYDKNKYGVYHLPNNVSPDLAFCTDGTTILNKHTYKNWASSSVLGNAKPQEPSKPNVNAPDQILSKGSKVKFPNGLRVESYNPNTGLILNSRIGGWINPSITYEDSAKDGKQDQYFANTNATFTIQGTYTVGNLKKSNGVWIAYLNELGFWVNCEPLIEIQN